MLTRLLLPLLALAALTAPAHAATPPRNPMLRIETGLYDMSGNVWEWVEDCWNGNYSGASTDGSYRMGGECGKRVLRGGSWNYKPDYARSAGRNRYDTTFLLNLIGFRPAKIIPP